VSKPSVGDLLPDFEAPTLAGGTLSADDLRGSATLLTFYRYASCPVCSATLAPYRVRAAELQERGVRIVAFFHSPVDRLLKYFKPDELPFDLVVDPAREVYSRFGVTPRPLALLNPAAMLSMPKSLPYMPGRNPLRGDGTLAIMPADFLVDPEGRFVEVHYGRHLADGWSIDRSLQLAKDHGLLHGAAASSPMRRASHA
jgi:peroxiredoxin